MGDPFDNFDNPLWFKVRKYKGRFRPYLHLTLKNVHDLQARKLGQLSNELGTYTTNNYCLYKIFPNDFILQFHVTFIFIYYF